MLAPDPPLIEALLGSAGVAALRADPDGAVLELYNEALLREWIPPEERAARAGDSLASTLALLFDDAEATRIAAGAQHCRAGAHSTAGTLTALPSRSRSRTLHPRSFDVGLLMLTGSGAGQLVITLTEVTALRAATTALEHARNAHDLALTVLSTDPIALREFLRQATAAVGSIRITLRMPARSLEAMREKLSRLATEAAALRDAASTLPLQNIGLPLQALIGRLGALREQESLSGDDLLPLVVQFDAIATTIAALLSLDEQRALALPSAAPRTTLRQGLPWHEICEQNCVELVRRAAARHGSLVELRIRGMALVPGTYHRAVELALRPLLRNAVQHGIEPPAARLSAEKSATGRITVTLRDHGAAGLELTVHDDGRGFDLERIRTAARRSGLGTDEELDAIDPRRLVGYVFRRRFSTTGLDASPAEDQGVSHLRLALMRQGGTISVATKSSRYTMFTIRLPAVGAGSLAAAEPAPHHALP